MEYELAKQLKDAGFYQIGRSRQFFVNGAIEENPVVATNYDVYVPTLSELIEACGKYLCLLQEDSEWIAYYDVQPFQKAGGIESIDIFLNRSAEGPTPEEAVAKLWIALQANK